MKLHLPLFLRTAVVSSVLVTLSQTVAYGDLEWDTPEGYYTDFGSGQSYSYKLMIDPSLGSVTLVDSYTHSAKTVKNKLLFQYVYRSLDHARKEWITSSTTKTTHTPVLRINENGYGNDVTWQCSGYNTRSGKLETPGVWILASAATSGTTAVFTNYGDMVVSDSRQQWGQAKCVELYNGEKTWETPSSFTNFEDKVLSKEKPSSSISRIGFNLKVTNSESFTYKNAYTSDAGAFIYGGKLNTTFDNLNHVTFCNNVAEEGGSIVYNTSAFKKDAPDNVGFIVRNISGAATFDSNQGSLFRNHLVRFDNVNEVVFSNNPSRIFQGNGYAEFKNCGSVSFVGNGREDLDEIITDAVYGIYGTSGMVFENCDYISFSGNTMESELFSDVFPKMDNIGSVSISNNTATGGTLVLYTVSNGKNASVNNLSGDFRMDNNRVTMDGGYAALLSLSSFTLNAVKNSQQTQVLSVSGNVVEGKIDRGLFAESSIVANYFDRVFLDKNSLSDSKASQLSAMFGKLTFNNVGNVYVRNNSVETYKAGRGIFGKLTLKDFGNLTVSGNKVTSEYGIYCGLFNSGLTARGKASGVSSITISGNAFSGSERSGSAPVGVIDAADLNSFVFKNNKLTITENQQTKKVTAYGSLGRRVLLENVREVNVTGNTLSSDVYGCSVTLNGGSFGGGTDYLKISEAVSVNISNNGVYTGIVRGVSNGGAMQGDILFNCVDKLTVSGNIAGAKVDVFDNPSGMSLEARGGAIYFGSTQTGAKGDMLRNCGSVTFSSNAARGYDVAAGGALYSNSAKMNGVESVTFSQNKALSSDSGSAYGGAVYGNEKSAWTNVEKLNFVKNYARGGMAYGGAMYWDASLTISSQFGTASCSFTGNFAQSTADGGVACGGAVLLDRDLTLSGFSNISFTGNYARAGALEDALGGAIFVSGGGSLTIENNKNVTFRGNYVTDGRKYSLSAIDRTKKSTHYLNLGAKANQEISVYDSICTSSTMRLNRNASHTGHIVLSGEYTVADLKAAGSKATAAEVERSRRVQAGYVYMGAGTVTVKDGMHLSSTGTFVQDGGVLQVQNAAISARSLKTRDVVFSGNNRVSFRTTLNGVNWTLQLNNNHKKSACIQLDSTYSSQEVVDCRYLKHLTLTSTEDLTTGTYRLISIDKSDLKWKYTAKLLISGLTDSGIGEKGESDIYFLTRGNTTTLVFDYVMPRTLTWRAASGIWGTGSGISASVWRSNERPGNFANGEKVVFNKTASVTIKGGVKPSSVKVSNASGNVIFKGYTSRSGIAGTTDLVKTGKGTLTINNTNTYTGGTSISGGTVKLGANNALGKGAITLSNATLDLGKKVISNNLTLSGTASILNGTNYRGNFTLNGNLRANSVLSIYASKTATLKKGIVTGTITGSGSTVVDGAVSLNGGKIQTKKLIISGSGKKLTVSGSGLQMTPSSSVISLSDGGELTSAGNISAKDMELSNKAVLNARNGSARNISLKGKLQATDSSISMYGDFSAANLNLSNSSMVNDGSFSRSITVSDSILLKNSKLDVKGYLRSKNLTLNSSSLSQRVGSAGVSLSGTFAMNSGSTLSVQGSLSAANMILAGGTLNMTSSDFSTIRVSGSLTMNGSIDLNLGSNLVTGRNYTLISFAKTNLTRSSNLTNLFGLTGSGATLTLGSKAITLKVTNATAWNNYLSANNAAFNKTDTVVNAMTPAAEETEVVEIAADTVTQSVAEPAYDRSSADMLVQSNWGVVNASRAFTDTLGNRTANRTVFGADDNSAVWLSAMGASSRLSSDGAAAGSDYNLFGAAVGMEQQLTEKSSLGLAIGESYGKVNSFTSARTKQDTLHTALYGQYSAVERSRDAVLLDWSAAYGRTESKWQGTEWEQKSVQLDARATWAHLLTADTTVSGFAGMQYFASESADIAPGIKSGSVQNLRGEIGVGIGHKLTGKTRLFSELSFVGDMVRHNPTSDVGGVRERGANPGRAGINFSVGGTHALNDKWSVNANYNLELMERANSHSANIGASYGF